MFYSLYFYFDELSSKKSHTELCICQTVIVMTDT